MKILITGCRGMLGSVLLDTMSRRHEVHGVDLEDGDLAASAVAEDLVDRTAPEWVVHCAAWTAVDEAESRRDEAMAANGLATELLAAACTRRQTGLTYVSTDYVFAGTGQGYAEDEPRDPVNHYGATKARGEEAVAALETPWQIVRTSWLFGDGRVNFVKTIRRLLGEHPTLRVVDDQRGCPTYAADLAVVLEFLVSERCRGIFHATNAGTCTWWELAREIARRLGADPERIDPCPSSEYPTAAVRPACSVLLSRRLEEVACPRRPAWQDAAGRYLDLLESGAAAHP